MIAQRAQERLVTVKRRARKSALRRPGGTDAPPSIQVSLSARVPQPEVIADEALTLDRRSAARWSVPGFQLLVRRIGGFSFDLELENVSTSGCRVEMVEECATGEDVITRFPQLEPLGGWVRWTLGTTAGVEFIRPIHPAVFDALLARLGTGDPAGK